MPLDREAGGVVRDEIRDGALARHAGGEGLRGAARRAEVRHHRVRRFGPWPVAEATGCRSAAAVRY
ncbi:hypothetical protein OQI_30010 [Streptomyces pharetrae CZA14]|uniref:Uncharacterized protein n=1 Tax=Streptomyces pharetrae CZA14 TaxID=1144883 RepID=A0ABX3YB62_9ACTN|nr:hypothetical protein OQI_30010 [Streptomyces pharetrae CZA14]